jgi:hypothetical protein
MEHGAKHEARKPHSHIGQERPPGSVTASTTAHRVMRRVVIRKSLVATQGWHIWVRLSKHLGCNSDKSRQSIETGISSHSEVYRVARVPKRVMRLSFCLPTIPEKRHSATAFGSQFEAMAPSDLVNLAPVMETDERLRGVDLILNRPGGAPETAEKIIMALRHFYDNDLRVVVPEFAKSSATIVALGADEIVMDFCSELGPIDPQMVTRDQSGQYQWRSAHAVVQSVDGYLDKLHAAIKVGPPFAGFLRLLDYAPNLAFVEECRLAQRLAKEIAEKWLKSGMLKEDPDGATKTAEKLSKADQLYSLGRPIDYRAAAEDLKLRIR